MLCISHADAPASPTQRKVAGLRLPVFDQEAGVRLPAEGERVGEAQQKEKVESVVGVKSATPFLLGEGLPPIPAKLLAKIQKGDFVDMAELLRDNIKVDQRCSKEGSASTSSGHRVGVKFLTY